MHGFSAPVVSTGPPPKQTNLSSKPLKSFNWVKIPPTKVKDTIWSDINDDSVHKVLKGEGYEEFESLFAAKETKMEQLSPVDVSGTIIDGINITAKEITFLDSKRSQNCSKK